MLLSHRLFCSLTVLGLFFSVATQAAVNDPTASSCDPATTTQTCVNSPCLSTLLGTTMLEKGGANLVACLLDSYTGTYLWKSMNGTGNYLGPSATDNSPRSPSSRYTGFFSDATSSASTVSIATSGIERLRVGSDGSIGISTTTPTAPLQFGDYLFLAQGKGNIGDAPDIYFSHQGLITAQTNMFFSSAGDGHFYWLTRATTASHDSPHRLMSLSNDGKLSFIHDDDFFMILGEGRGNIGDGPDIHFTHQGLITSNTNMFFSSAGDGHFYWLTRSHTASHDSPNRIMQLTNDGNLYLKGKAFQDSTYGVSDQRLKDNIHPLSYGLETVMKLKPVTYELKKTHEKQVGLIAQDVEPVVPEVVSKNPEGMFGISYGNLVAVVIKAMQEMKTENDGLTKENGELRQQLGDMRQRLDSLEAIVSNKGGSTTKP